MARTSRLHIITEALRATLEHTGGLPSDDVIEKQIKLLFLEVIGPDEEVKTNIEAGGKQKRDRNELRQELRQLVEAL